MADELFSTTNSTSTDALVQLDASEDQLVAAQVSEGSLSTGERLSAGLELVWADLASRAASADFLALLTEVFGATGADAEAFALAAQDLSTRLASGDRLGLRFELETAAEMGNAAGAYAVVGDDGVSTIYINGDWLTTASDDLLQRVLLEEIGHSFDTQLNGSTDTAGDEGELFANLYTGTVLTDEQRALISAENDQTTLIIDGQTVLVEEATVPTSVPLSYTENAAGISTANYLGLFNSASSIATGGSFTNAGTASVAANQYLSFKLTNWKAGDSFSFNNGTTADINGSSLPTTGINLTFLVAGGNPGTTQTIQDTTTTPASGAFTFGGGPSTVRPTVQIEYESATVAYVRFFFSSSSTTANTIKTALSNSSAFSNSSDNPANGTTPRALFIEITDNQFPSAVASGQGIALASVNITGVNDQPVLNTNFNPSLTAIEAQNGSPTASSTGQSVNTLIGLSGLINGSFTNQVVDPDNTSFGIAVTSVNSTAGTLWYRVSGVSSWTQAPANLSDTNALVLKPDAQVYFQSGANTGTFSAAIRFKAWDQSDNLNSGSTSVNTTSNLAYSSLADDISIQINAAGALNAAPSLNAQTVALVTVLDTTGVPLLGSTTNSTPISQLTAGFSDPSTGANQVSQTQGIAITSGPNPANSGTLYYTIDNGVNWIALDTSQLSQGKALLLLDTPQTRLYFDPSGTAGSYTAMSFRAWDGTNGTAGLSGSYYTLPTTFTADGAFSTAVQAADVNVITATASIFYENQPTLTDPFTATINPAFTVNNAFTIKIEGVRNGDFITIPTSTTTTASLSLTSNSSGSLNFTSGNGTGYTSIYDVGGGSWTVTFNGISNANKQTIVNGIFFGNNRDDLATDSTRLLTLLNGDANAAALAERAQITVYGLNDAPALNPQAQGFVYSTVLNPGGEPPSNNSIANSMLVSAFVAQITDADGPAGSLPDGIAITNVNSGYNLYYTTNGGVTWNLAPNIASGNGLQLADNVNTRIYLQAKSSTLTGGQALTFIAWDQTVGVSGTVASVQTAGGTSAYSTQQDTIVATVAPSALPLIDLNGAITGIDQVGSFSEGNNPISFTQAGVTNFSNNPAGDTVSTVRLSFDLVNFSNGSDERLFIAATNYGIATDFASGSSGTFLIGATTYNWSSSVVGGTTSIAFTKSGGLSTSDVEALLDSFRYQNTSSDPTSGAGRVFSLVAIDGDGTSAIAKFTISVSGVNNPPTVTAAIPDQTVSEGLPFAYQFSASTFTDLDGDTLTYTAKLSDGNPLPAWVQFNAAERRFYGSPPKNSPDLTIALTATDGSGASATDTFVLATVDYNVNPISSSNPGFAYLKLTTAYQLVNGGTFSSSGYYEEETNDFQTASAPLQGTNFVFYQEGSATFSGNNVPGWLAYNDVNGNVVRIRGEATRPIKSPTNQFEGVYLWVEDPDADGPYNPATPTATDPDGSTDNTAYVLSFGSFFYGNQVQISSSDRVDAALNGLLDQPALAISSATITEGGQLQFTVTRTGDLTKSSTVDYTTAILTGNTASASDFTAASGTLTFANGESSKTILVNTTNDSFFELSETLSVQLTNASGARIDVDTAIGTIIDNDPTPAFSVSDAGNLEGNKITFTVTRSSNTLLTQTVNWATAFDTTGPNPADAADFTSASGVLTFAAGETSKTVVIDTTIDFIQEQKFETFNLILSEPTNGATIDDGTGLGVIQDDEGTSYYSVANVTRNEADGTITFTVSRTQLVGEVQTLTYNFATKSGDATVAASNGTGVDVFGTLSGTLSFATNELSKTVVLNIVDDSISEADEKFYITLSNLSSLNNSGAIATEFSSYNGDGTLSTGVSLSGGLPTGTATSTYAVGTIIDNDSASYTVTGGTIEEGGNIVFTITLNKASSSTQTVDYTTAILPGNSATAPDFTANQGSLTFAPGQTSKSVTIATIDDSINEATETFSLQLSNPVGGATIATGTATGTITDNDKPTLSISSPTVVEGSIAPNNYNYAYFSITLNAPGDADVTFALDLLSGTGTAGTDAYNIEVYNGSSWVSYTTGGTVTIPAGNVVQRVRVRVADDGISDNNETVLLQATGITNTANTPATATGTLTILDTNVSLSCTGGPEGPTASYLITASLPNLKPSIGQTVVTVNKADGSTIGTITIANGETQGTLTTPANNGEDPYKDPSSLQVYSSSAIVTSPEGDQYSIPMLNGSTNPVTGNTADTIDPTSLSFSGTSVNEGGTQTITASLTNPAAEALTLTLSRQGQTLSIPIAAGASSGTTTFTASDAEFNHLSAGATQSVSFAVSVSTNTFENLQYSNVLNLTVTGVNDPPSINPGQNSGSVTEDGSYDNGAPLVGVPSVSQTLSASDVDDNYVHTWSLVGTQPTTYGTMTIGAQTGVWTYALNNADPDTEALREGDSVTQSYTAQVTDEFGASATQTITVTITGTNDAPVITTAAGGNAGSVTEDGSFDNGDPWTFTSSVSGTLSATDVDQPDGHTWSLVGTPSTTYGTMTIDPTTAVWTYNLDNADADTQGLREGESVTQSYTAQVLDEFGATATQTITVTITGTNDAPVIQETAQVGSVTEAGSLDDGTPVAGTSSVSGTFTATDVDTLPGKTWSLVGDAPDTYGSMAVDAATGVWTYTLDNADSDTEGLREGESVTQSYTVQVIDEFGASDTETVTITITGTNDVPVITTAEGGNAGSVTEDGSFDNGDPWTFTSSVSGTLSATDVDQPDGHTWSLVGTPSTTYGTMTIDPTTAVWTYNLDNADADTQGLREGESVTQSYTAQVLDEFGATATQTITVTITGTNDAPVIQETAQVGSVTEAGSLDDGTPVAGTSSVSGTFTATDVDTLPGKTWSLVGDVPDTYGSMAVDAATGVWTYTLDNADSDTEGLREGESVTQSYTVQVIDEFGASDTETVTITITGTNDVPVITTAEGGNAGSVTEDGSFDNGDPWTFTSSVSGTLSATDVDQPDGHTWSLVGTPSTTYGTMTIDPTTAVWTYNLDNADADTQGLREGESVTQSYTAQVLDEFGATATQTITVTITGTNDAPVIQETAQVGSVTEAGSLDDGTPVAGTSSVSGTFTATDVDTLPGKTWSLVGDVPDTYGSMAVDAATGVWTYTLDNADPDTEGLREGDSVTQTYTVQVIDEFGASDTETVTITITGTNDVPVITTAEGGNAGSVTEDGSFDNGDPWTFTSSVSGTLSATDVDQPDGHTWSLVGTPSTTYGTMTIDPMTAVWTYNLDNADADTQGLREGESVTQSYTAQVLDEFGATATQTITVTITGTNDAPVIQETAQVGSVTEAGSLDDGTAVPGTSSVSGTFTATDVDTLPGKTWSLVGDAPDTYGSMAVDAATGVWTYTLDNADSDTEGLREGDSVTQTYTVQVIDEFGASDTETVTITITGTNDVPVITTAEGGNAGSVTEDGSFDNGDPWTFTSSVSGTLSATDVDQPDGHTWSLVGTPSTTYGTMTIDPTTAVWTYNLDNADADTQGLREGESVTQSYTAQVLDEFGATATQTITVTITGTNDAPVIQETAQVGSVTEAGSLDDGTAVPGTSSVSGTFTATDVDTLPGKTWSLVGDAPDTYGSMAVDAATGVWTYTLDNADSDTEGLREGDSVTQTYTVQVIDEFGASDTETVTITITGTNDAPVIQETAQVGSVTEAGSLDDGTPVAGTSSVSGTFTATDVDTLPGKTWSLVGDVPDTYGSMAVDAATGVWTYTLDNADSDTEGLREGESVTQSYTVQVIDEFGASDTETVTITITGTNDVPVITTAEGGNAGSVTEDGSFDNGDPWTFTSSVSGTLSATDVDQPDGHTWSLVGTPSTTYGTMTIDPTTAVWTYNLDNADADTQGLREGESVTQSYTAQVLDEFGATATQTITVTITGTNDAPVIQETAQVGSVTEAGSLDDGTPVAGTSSVSGTFTATDVDTLPGKTWSLVGDVPDTYGSMAVDAATGVWTYTLDNADSDTEGLREGDSVTQTYTVQVIDEFGASDTETVTITITGTNDVPVITTAEGGNAGSVTEDGSFDNGDPRTFTSSVGGTLSATDVDQATGHTWSLVGTPSTTYGTMTIDPTTAVWTYNLNNTDADTQGLREGQSVTQSYTAQVLDEFGATATQTITVTITGTNDAPVIQETAQVGSVTEAGSLDDGTPVAGTSSVSGTFTATDVDTLPGKTWSLVGDVPDTYGSMAVDAATGVWTYTLDNADPDTEGLREGDSVTQTYTVQVIDEFGASDTETVTITITGTNDVPVITTAEGGNAGSVTEDGSFDNGDPWTFTSSVSGTLSATDVDQPDGHTWSLVGTPSTTYGTMTIDPMTAVWTYNLDNADADTQGLREGESVTQSYTAQVLDEFGATATQTITVTITGTNDAPVIQETAQVGSVTEAGSLDDGTAVPGTSSVSGTFTATDVDTLPGKTWSLVGDAPDTYGSMAVDAATGVWTYTLDNADSDTEGLREGDSVTQTYTVQVIDEFGASDTETVTITITGTNDVPVITTAEGGNAGSVTEDGSFDNGDPWTFTSSVSGTLSATDVDQPDGHTWSLVGTPSTTYGTMTIDPTTAVWTYNLDNADADTQGLREGESVTQSYTAQVLDEFGATATQTITVTITGTNDAPVIQETAQVGSVTEAGSLDDGTAVPGTSSVSGTFTATDVDTLPGKTWSLVGDAPDTYGSMAVDAATGVWTYTLDNADSDTEGLREGDSVTQTYTVQVIDEFGASDTETVTITITGTNDAPVIQETAQVGSVTEAGSLDDGTPVAGTSSVSGTFTATDVDTLPGKTWSLVGDVPDTYGSMAVDAATGVWTYTLDNADSDTEGLREGESVTQSYTVQVIDEFGASDTETVTITITGTNDVPVITTAEGGNAGSVTEDGSFDNGDPWTFTSSVSGTLSATDVDQPDGHTWSLVGTPSTTYGTMTIDPTTAVWTYNLDNADADTQGLREGESVTQSYTAQVLDEFGATATQTITVTITGTNDAPVIQETAQVGSVTEAGSLDDGTPVAGTSSVSGTFTATDVDTLPGKTWSLVGDVPDTYGSMAVDAATGVWTYTLDNADSDTEGLREGDSVTQTYTVQVIDEFGASDTETVTITITGTNDVPVITTAEGGNAGSVTEDGSFDNGDPRTFTSSVGGTLSATDVDQATGHTWSLVGTPSTTYGTMTIDPTTAVWTYNLNNTDADTQGLREGQSVTQSYTAQVLDEFGATATQTITVTITGTNDAPVIQETAQTGTVSEAGSLDDGTAVPGTSSASGTFTATDVDTLAVKTWTIAGTPSTTYGTMTIGAQSGVWTYALNNADPDTEALREGDSVTQTYTVQVTDEFGASDTETVTITITGTNDVPVITTAAGGNAGSVTEDGSYDDGTFRAGSPTVGGTLSATDVDQPSGHTWSLVGTPSTTYGTMTIDPTTAVWTYNLDNADVDTQGLREGQSVTQSYTAQVLDEFGATATQTITVTITGTNDAPVIQTPPQNAPQFEASPPVISSAFTGSVSEDGTDDAGNAVAGTSSVSGTLTATDVDANDHQAWSLVGAQPTTYGTMTIGAQSGVWTYTLDNNDPDTQALREGQSVTQTYTAQVMDDFGATDTETITITITGSNDAPTINAGGDNGSVVEAGNLDNGAVVQGIPTVSGTLTVTDVDQPSGHTWSLVGAQPSTYGSMAINATTGVWTYNLDNADLDTQGIAEGESQTQTYTAQVTDAFGASATQTVTITITGTNDMPDIGVQTGDKASHSFTETTSAPGTASPGLTTTGSLSVRDLDISDTVSTVKDGVSFAGSGNGFRPAALDSTAALAMLTLTAGNSANPAAGNALNNLSWSFNSGSQGFDYLAAGEVQQLTYTLKATDNNGASDTQTVVISVTGTNDVAVISGTSNGEVIEKGGSPNGGQNDSYAELYTGFTGKTDPPAGYYGIAGGTLSVVDLDHDQQFFTPTQTPLKGTYGSFTINQNGVWSYTLDETLAEPLGKGESTVETFLVYSKDSSASQTVSVMVYGADDSARLTVSSNNTSVHYSDRIDKLEITAFDPDGPANLIKTTWSFQQWVDSNSNGLIESSEWVERGTAANTSPSEIIIGLDSGTYGEPKNLRFAPAVINNNTLRYTLMGTTDLAVGSYRLVGTFKDADGLSAISNSVINVTPEELKLNWKGSAWVGAPVKALTDPALGSVFFASQLNEIDLQPGGLTQLAQRVQSGIYPSGDPLTVGQPTDFYVNFRDKNSGAIVGSTLPAGSYYVFNGVTSGYNPATFTLPTGARSFVVPVNSPFTYNGTTIALPKVSLSISGNLDGNGRVTAWMEQPVSLTGSETSKDYLIATEVGGKYYQRSNTLDDTVVTYAKTALSMAGATGPINLDQATQGTTGGQSLTIGSGTNAKTVLAGGSDRVSFSSSLNVESNKTGTNLKGKLLLNISSEYDLVTGQPFADGKEHSYVITTNAWNSFGMGSVSSSGVVQYQNGNLIGKANGIDTTTGLSLGGNLSVQINFRDYDVGTDSATGTSTFNGVVYQASNGGNKSLSTTYSNQTDQISISLIDGTKGNSLFQTNGFWNMAWTSTIVDQLNPDFTRPNIAM